MSRGAKAREPTRAPTTCREHVRAKGELAPQRQLAQRTLFDAPQYRAHATRLPLAESAGIPLIGRRSARVSCHGAPQFAAVKQPGFRQKRCSRRLSEHLCVAQAGRRVSGARVSFCFSEQSMCNDCATFTRYTVVGTGLGFFSPYSVCVFLPGPKINEVYRFEEHASRDEKSGLK